VGTLNQTIRYDKGLGNAEVYARIINGATFWDFVALAWVGAETSHCRVFLAEFDDTSATQSWYYAQITPPTGGPWPVEIYRLSGVLIGNDFAFYSAPLVGPGTLKCSAPIAAASRQLTDVSGITWPASVLLVYLNYAVREILDAKPEANAVLALLDMVAGTRQALPTGWNVLINAKRNMGANGMTPGLVISQVPRLIIDSALPDWHTWPADPIVRNVITDDRDPYFFDTFPPQPADTTQKIEAIGSVYPAKATDPANDGFPLPGAYEVPAVDYMIYRALYESTTIPNALAKATTSLNKFYQGLGIKTQTSAKVQSQGQ
jgi:hypothetical protein